MSVIRDAMAKALLEFPVFLLILALDGALINAVTLSVDPPEIDFECGVGATKLATKITGSASSVAHRNSWPWMALLGIRRAALVNDEIRTENRWFCGGVLINDQWVMTAAHCVEEPNLTFFVRLGEHDSSSDVDGASPEDYEVKSVLPHPQYADIYYDMALVELKVPVTFSNSISPICIPWKVDRDVTQGDDVYISGWGSTHHRGEASPVLREAIVKIQNTQKCEENYRGRNPSFFKLQFSKGITDRHLICAGDDKGTDTCQGDSGGPLSILDPSTGRFFLVGTVSTGIGCGHNELPGLYTNITSELLWIRRTAFQSSSCSQDSQCPRDAVCFAGSCAKLCGKRRCGRGALCRVFRRRPICHCPGGYDGDPFVSCTRGGSPGVTLTRRPTPTPTPRPQRNLLPTGRACGYPVTDDNHGQDGPVRLGAYPWVVAIGYTEGGKPGMKFVCAGSLINYRYVLTAAHCLDRKYLRRGRPTVLHLGDYDLKCIEDCQTSKSCAPHHLVLSPEDIIVHEDFDKGESFSNNIGLIRLNESIAFGKIKAFVRPVCLPVAGLNVRSAVGGREAIATDWGFVNSTFSYVLRRLGLPVVDDGLCRKRWGPQFLPNQLCVGGQLGKDICGNAGPLVIAGQSGPPFTLIGLSNYGTFPCGLADFPSVYTNVADYKDWIEGHLKP